MQRIMFSGGTIPSRRDQRRNNRQGRRSCNARTHASGVEGGGNKRELQKNFAKEAEEEEKGERHATRLEPNDNQVPEPDQTDLGRGHPVPPPLSRILERDDVHGMQDEFHRHPAREEPNRVRDQRERGRFLRCCCDDRSSFSLGDIFVVVGGGGGCGCRTVQICGCGRRTHGGWRELSDKGRVGHDRTGEVQRWVQDVGEVEHERVVASGRGRVQCRRLIL